MKASVVDLFCGAGGLTRGLEDANIQVNAGVDADPECKYPFEENNEAEFFERDITEMRAEDLSSIYPEGHEKILVGCAPCQPFSQFNQGEDTTCDLEWGLLYDFADHIEAIEPIVVSMENVPQLVDHSVFEDYVARLEELGYNIWYNKVRAPEYGVPQDRERLILLGSRLGDIELIDPIYPDPRDYPSVKEYIGHLPEIEAGQGNAHNEDGFHRSAGLGEKNIKRIRASVPGGTWEDWPEDLRLSCHTKDSGSSYVGVYGRMEWDEPAPTITTQFYNYGSGRFGHPQQDRAISFREGALLQTFPRDYAFRPEGERINNDVAGRLIGNAVPVKLGEAIGESIKQHLKSHEIDPEVISVAQSA